MRLKMAFLLSEKERKNERKKPRIWLSSIKVSWTMKKLTSKSKKNCINNKVNKPSKKRKSKSESIQLNFANSKKSIVSLASASRRNDKTKR